MYTKSAGKKNRLWINPQAIAYMNIDLGAYLPSALAII